MEKYEERTPLKTKKSDLPPEVVDIIVGNLTHLTYEEYTDLRIISKSLDRYHLVLSNLSVDNIQYFKPQAHQVTPYLFKSLKSFTKALNSHIKKYGVSHDDLTLFIEYQEPVMFYNWYLGKYFSNCTLLEHLNRNIMESTDQDAEIYDLFHVLTGLRFNTEIFLRALISPFNFKKALLSDISIVLDRRAIKIGSYPFLFKPSGPVSLESERLKSWPRRSSVEPDIYIFDPSLQRKVDIDVYKEMEEIAWNKSTDQFVKQCSTVKEYHSDTLLSKTLLDFKATNGTYEDQDLEMHFSMLQASKLGVLSLNISAFTELTHLCLNQSGLKRITNCDFPNLETFELYRTSIGSKKIWKGACVIAKNKFPKLNKLHIRCRTIPAFEENDFGESALEELILDCDLVTTKNCQEIKSLIGNSGKVELSGRTFNGLVLDIFDDISKGEQTNSVGPHLHQLIISEISLENLELLLEQNLTNVKELKISSVNENIKVLDTTPKTFQRYNFSLNINPPENEHKPLTINFSNLETLYLLNCNIPLVLKPPKLHNVIFSHPSPMDDYHRYTKFTTFHNEMEFRGEFDFSDDAIIYEYDCSSVETGESIDLTTIDATQKNIWFCGSNISQKTENVQDAVNEAIN